MTRYRELAIFCRKMNSALHAGFDIERALDLVLEESDTPRMKAALKSTSDGVSAGKRLSQAMRSAEDVFTTELINGVYVTEQTGHIEEAFGHFADRFERSDDTRRKIRQAALYPTIVIIVLILSVLAVAYANGRFLSALAWIGGIAMILIFIVWLIASGKRAGEESALAGSILIKLPVVGSLILKEEMADLAGNLAIFYACGVLTDQALRYSARSIDYEILRTKVLGAADLVEKGNLLSDSLQMQGVFPPKLILSIRTGETSGGLDDMLKTVEKYYRDDVRNTVDRMFAAIRQ